MVSKKKGKRDIVTEDESRFIDEYMLCGNGTQAAIKIGSTPKGAGDLATRMMARPRVKLELEKRRARRTAKVDVSVERILEAAARIAFSDPRAMYNDDGTLKAPKDWPTDLAMTIDGMEVNETTTGGDDPITRRSHKVHRSRRMEALRFLGEYQAMLKQRVIVNGDENGGPVKLTVSHDLSKLDDNQLAALYRDTVAPPVGAG